ncbi:MAG: TonB-dependent receptor domain-containing protein [Gemmatimonadaceae bacterium]
MAGNRPTRLFLQLLIFISPVVAQAQNGAPAGILEGRVLFAGTTAPIPGATVIVVGTRLGTFTDSIGGFRIEGVPMGQHDVEAQHYGKAVSRVSVTVKNGIPIIANFVLADAVVALARVEVIGSAADALARLPGAASIVSSRALSAQQPVSANEALRTVLGLHVQEEEGLGLRANIGIRGLDPDRSRTVLVLEDGVPVALAPYGEPEMYYSPPIDRMERIEVIKGSGSILFGPQTVGGVVNYVTADAPVTPSGALQAQAGTGDSRLLKARYGGTWGAVRGTVGAFQKRAHDLNGLRFQVNDATGKVGVRTARGNFGVKLSAYDESSNATYVGLTDSIFRASPYIHPAPGDHLDLRRVAVTASHEAGIGAGTFLRTSLYGYETTRNWNRRDYAYTPTGRNFDFRNTSGSRNRSFDVVGLEPRLHSSWSAGGVRSDLDVGVRVHYERARDKHINGFVDSLPAVVRDDEVRTGRALAAFVQNRFFVTPRLHLTPGVRFERFEFDRNILRMRVARSDGVTTTRFPEDVDIRSSDAVSEVIPGLGAAWTPTARASVFAGVHRGFAPPRTKDALVYGNQTLSPDQQVPDPVSLDLDAERSWNYEVGTRLTPTRFLSLEATAFFLDFSNQIVAPALSAGSTAQGAFANQGATRHRGIEAGVSFDAGKFFSRSYSLSASVGYTFVDARFSNSRRLLNANSDTVDIDGNQLPYAPRQRANGALTFEHPSGVVIRADGTYVSEQFADNFETLAGSANGRVGLIPAYRVFDASARLPVPGISRLIVTASVKNLSGATYIASRRPEGIKPGLPRLVSVGVILGL